MRPARAGRIDASAVGLAGSSRTVSFTLPIGPGPSLVNMPAPGCWTLTVSWADHTDLVRLRYAAARAQ
jgi:hypothetical protein